MTIESNFSPNNAPIPKGNETSRTEANQLLDTAKIQMGISPDKLVTKLPPEMQKDSKSLCNFSNVNHPKLKRHEGDDREEEAKKHKEPEVEGDLLALEHFLDISEEEVCRTISRMFKQTIAVMGNEISKPLAAAGARAAIDPSLINERTNPKVLLIADLFTDLGYTLTACKQISQEILRVNEQIKHESKESQRDNAAIADEKREQIKTAIDIVVKQLASEGKIFTEKSSQLLGVVGLLLPTFSRSLTSVIHPSAIAMMITIEEIVLNDLKEVGTVIYHSESALTVLARGISYLFPMEARSRVEEFLKSNLALFLFTLSITGKYGSIILKALLRSRTLKRTMTQLGMKVAALTGEKEEEELRESCLAAVNVLLELGRISSEGLENLAKKAAAPPTKVETEVEERTGETATAFSQAIIKRENKDIERNLRKVEFDEKRKHTIAEQLALPPEQVDQALQHLSVESGEIPVRTERMIGSLNALMSGEITISSGCA